jgi:hypothetical protein
MTMRTYLETFDDGPGGWCDWFDNARGLKPLEIRDGCAISRSPWWIDYNNAPPGAGYLHLPFALQTRGMMGEYAREVCGRNRFIEGKFPTNFADARVTVRIKGELEARGAQLILLCQSIHNDLCSGWLLTSRPFEVKPEWSEQTAALPPDESAWRSLGGRHDRGDFYVRADLMPVLTDVNVNILFVLFPLNIVPMGPIAGHPDFLRPEKDYPVWRSRLPEGYIMLDTVRIDFAG